MNTIGRIEGRFTGAESRHDTAGKTETYHVVQTNRATAAGFEAQFQRAVAEDPTRS